MRFCDTDDISLSDRLFSTALQTMVEKKMFKKKKQWPRSCMINNIWGSVLSVRQQCTGNVLLTKALDDDSLLLRKIYLSLLASSSLSLEFPTNPHFLQYNQWFPMLLWSSGKLDWLAFLLSKKIIFLPEIDNRLIWHDLWALCFMLFTFISSISSIFSEFLIESHW